MISIHAPREGSDERPHGGHRQPAHFYPRSPRGERPTTSTSEIRYGYDFYPRSPRGERHTIRVTVSHDDYISIHAPREGSDSRPCRQPRRRQNFYPRSPRGERRRVSTMPKQLPYFYPRSPRGERLRAASRAACQASFLSTLPARGATRRTAAGRQRVHRISIHAPREGSDVWTVAAALWGY